jgi:hypothetical protein
VSGTPAIPARLASRPTSGGLVHPWVNVELADGGIDYRSPHYARVARAWRARLCQVDGQPHDTWLVFLAGPNQLRELVFDEPPVHPECAAYAQQACPMVAGRMSHYADRARVAEGARGATCPDPSCGCEGWVPHPGGTDSGGDPAHAWYAVWARGYTLALTPEGDVHGGAVHPRDVVRVRLVSTPGEPTTGPRTLSSDEVAALITAPTLGGDA